MGKKSDKNKQIGGNHYEGQAIQPIDIIRANKLDFFEGNALKYLLRYKGKNGVEDLDKCSHYIMMIKENYIKKRKMENVEEMIALGAKLQYEATKFYEKGNSAAGTRARGILMKMGKLSKVIRVDIQETKNAKK